MRGKVASEVETSAGEGDRENYSDKSGIDHGPDDGDDDDDDDDDEILVYDCALNEESWFVAGVRRDWPSAFLAF